MSVDIYCAVRDKPLDGRTTRVHQ